MSLKESLNPTVSYRYKNIDTVNVQRLALFAGHYDTSEISKDASGNKMFITHGNPTALVDAGYSCDQVADDYNSNVANTSRGNADPIRITPVRGRTRVVDFMNYVKFSGLKVKKIRITDLSNDSTRALLTDSWKSLNHLSVQRVEQTISSFQLTLIQETSRQTSLKLTLKNKICC